MGNIFLAKAEARRLQHELTDLFQRYLKLTHGDEITERDEYLFLYTFSSAQ